VDGARRYDLCIFDLDGTLADTREDIAQAANRMRAELGLAETAPERIYGYIGRGVHNLVARTLEGAAADRLDEAVQRFRVHYGAHLLDRTRLYPGVAELLAALNGGGVRCAVATNKPEGFSRDILAGLGVAARFEHVLGGDSVENRKPHPEAVQRILRAAGIAAERTLFVGDSLIDVETAAAAGVDCAVVAWGYEDPGALAGAVVKARFRTAAEIAPFVLGRVP
jgi:phosphoglycolate phosphatase